MYGIPLVSQWLRHWAFTARRAVLIPGPGRSHMLHSVTKKEKETNKRSIISHEKTQYICGPGLTEGLLVYGLLLKYTAVSVCTKSHDYNSRACRETWGAVDKYKHTYTGAHSEKRWVGEILFKIEQSENLDGKYYTPESIINSNSGLTYNLSALTVSAYWVTNWTLEIAYAPIPSSGASWKVRAAILSLLLKMRKLL